MSKRYLLAGASALMLALALPMPSTAQTYGHDDALFCRRRAAGAE